MSQLAFKCLWETLGGTPTLTSLNKQRRHPTEHRGEENPAAFPLKNFSRSFHDSIQSIEASIEKNQLDLTLIF